MANKLLEGKKPCIWMEVGVIDYKICNRDFECQECEFDRAMTEAAARHVAQRQAAFKPPEAPWEDKMRQRFEGQSRCQFMLTSYCHHCSFEELLEEQFDFFLAPEKPRLQEVFGIRVPTSSFLHQGHTWVALENAGRVRLGLDDFAQKVLGPPGSLKLPAVGERLRANESCLVVKRGQKKAPVLAPLEGVVEAVNLEVRRRPGLVHDDPYGEGWLLLVSPTNLKPDLEKMLFGHCNVAWMEHEAYRLMTLVESATGLTLPSGGAIIDDVFGHYPQLGWRRLVREFLHSA